jgi:hypothetical protein
MEANAQYMVLIKNVVTTSKKIDFCKHNIT